MKFIDKVAYGLAIKLQMQHMEICDCQGTVAFDNWFDLGRRNGNWALVNAFDGSKDPKEEFAMYKDIFADRLESDVAYEYLPWYSPIQYVLTQLMSWDINRTTIKRARRELKAKEVCTEGR